ncbi:MAG: hypothetical protein ABSH41_17070 [Syntrophobacteraceae bacterium]
MTEARAAKRSFGREHYRRPPSGRCVHCRVVRHTYRERKPALCLLHAHLDSWKDALITGGFQSSETAVGAWIIAVVEALMVQMRAAALTNLPGNRV